MQINFHIPIKGVTWFRWFLLIIPRTKARTLEFLPTAFYLYVSDMLRWVSDAYEFCIENLHQIAVKSNSKLTQTQA